jgi:hypothetical protein
MADRSASRQVGDGRTETLVERDEATVRNPVPRSDPWLSVYAALARRVPRATLFFGGLSALGLLVLVRQLYALAAMARWSVLPAEAVVGAAASCAFGLGYFAVRDESSCRSCGASFSKERVACRPVRRESDSHGGGTFVCETFECRECGDRTESTYPFPDRPYPRN